MPGRLVVCNRLTLSLAADDLAIPALVGVFIRFWAAVVSGILLIVALNQQTTCSAMPVDVLILAGTFVIASIPFVLYIVLFRVSTSGTMLESKERDKKALPIIYSLGATYLVEIILGIIGVVRLATSPCPVGSPLMILEAIFAAVILLDFAILGLVLGLLFYFAQGKKPRDLDETVYQKPVATVLRRAGLLCCGLFGSLESPGGYQELAWSEISRIVHAFLKDLLVDFTVFDVFAAFVLLRAEQRDKEKERVKREIQLSSSPAIPNSSKMIRFKSQSFTASTPISASSDPKGIEAIKLFHEFAPYAIGNYGWKLQAVMNPCTLVSQLPVAMARHCIYGNHVDHHVFSSVIGTSPNKRRIVYSSFTSYLGEAVPYTITVDHEKKAVVITLRYVAFELINEKLN